MYEKVNGKSKITTKVGSLNVAAKTKKGYIRIPYSLLRANDFIDLDPFAVKIYFLLLRQWRTHEQDKPVIIALKEIRDLCARKVDDKIIKPSYSTISGAIKQLMTFGFIHKTTRHRVCNQYWVEQKWFTGEYR